MTRSRSLLFYVLAIAAASPAHAAAGAHLSAIDGLSSTTSSTSSREDFFCEVDVTLYDAVAVHSLAFMPWFERCRLFIPGVTIRETLPPFRRMILENFPDGFRGPATLMACGEDVPHFECSPTLEELDGVFTVMEAEAPDGTEIDPPAVCASFIDCDRWECGPVGPYIADECGDANGDHDLVASDALLILRASVGSEPTCPVTRCDADRSGVLTATDALLALRASVGAAADLLCPAPCPAG